MPFTLADISIPVSIFFGLYGIFLCCYVIYGFFNLVHLLEYGRVGAPLFAIVIGFVGGTVLLVAGSIIWLFHYDLTYTVPLGEMINSFKQYFSHKTAF
ncbi:MAG: hypothetical protein NTX72_00140 [Candidatus Uhrbacteria bacterium]|nr:hypothetical protein [Candidatus Uhrbacteria bacterium]